MITFKYQSNEYKITTAGQGLEVHYENDPKRPYVLVERTDHVMRMWQSYQDEMIADYHDVQETYDELLAGAGRK